MSTEKIPRIQASPAYSEAEKADLFGQLLSGSGGETRDSDTVQEQNHVAQNALNENISASTPRSSSEGSTDSKESKLPQAKMSEGNRAALVKEYKGTSAELEARQRELNEQWVANTNALNSVAAAIDRLTGLKPAGPAAPLVPPPIPKISEVIPPTGSVDSEYVEMYAQIAGLVDADARKTFESTWRSFPVKILTPLSPDATPEQRTAYDEEVRTNERNKRLRDVMVKRKFEVWKDTERKTKPEDVKAIAEAILKFQEQPWYIRAGLSGVLGAAGKGTLLAVGVSTLAAFATLGAVTSAPISIPMTAALAIGAGRYRHWLNNVQAANEMGYGKNPFIFKYPRVCAALSGVLYGSIAYVGTSAVLTPGGRLAIANFFSSIASGTKATLSQLLSYLSAGKALSAKVAIGA